MDVRSEDISGLLALQDIDIKIGRQKKELSELPQRAQIKSARERAQAMAARREQVETLKANAQKRLNRVKDEDAALAEKQADVEQTINKIQGDFRSVEAHTKELESISHQRSELQEELEHAQEDLNKINSVESQIDTVIEDANKTESAAEQSLQREEDSLNQEIEQLERSRSETIDTMSDDVVALYEKTVRNLGSIVVGHLVDGTCSVCRSSIDGGRLIDLQAQAPLGLCPSCKRLLIID